MSPIFKKIIEGIALGLGFVFVLMVANAQSGNPPAGNPPPPLNTGSVAQTKTGNLRVDGQFDANTGVRVDGVGILHGNGGKYIGPDLTASDLAPNSVTSSELADNSVNSNKVVNNSLTASDLAPNSVASSELADNSVNSNKVVNNSLTASDLAPNSVANSEMIDNPTFNDVYANNWFRAKNDPGIYWQKHGGGWRMLGSTYIETYNGKSVLVTGTGILSADDTVARDRTCVRGQCITSFKPVFETQNISSACTSEFQGRVCLGSYCSGWETLSSVDLCGGFDNSP